MAHYTIDKSQVFIFFTAQWIHSGEHWTEKNSYIYFQQYKAALILQRSQQQHNEMCTMNGLSVEGITTITFPTFNVQNF
jgi:hypothetical protein